MYLLELVKIAAPYIPFISEAIYQNLRTPEMPESVHFCDFPAYQKERRREKAWKRRWQLCRVTVSLGHALRKEHKLKVRQPLPAAHLASSDAQILSFLQDQQHLIAEELNVKKVHFQQR